MELARQEPEPEEMEVWCLIVGMVGTAFPVTVKGTDRVWELQKTIKNEAVEIFGDFNAAQLRLYLAKNDSGQWLSAAEVQAIENGDARPARSLLARGHLASMSQLVGILKGRDANSVHILVPAPSKSSEIEVEPDIAGKRKRSEQSFGEVEKIGVSAEEWKFLFDILRQKKTSWAWGPACLLWICCDTNPARVLQGIRWLSVVLLRTAGGTCALGAGHADSVEKREAGCACGLGGCRQIVLCYACKSLCGACREEKSFGGTTSAGIFRSECSGLP